MPRQDTTINYIELPAVDIPKTKEFYSGAFGWEFTDYGPGYVSFSGAGIDGGFNGMSTPVNSPGVLVVLYASDLESIQGRIQKAGGTIVKPTYDFPGGRRFHFRDPNGNELAVWSDT